MASTEERLTRLEEQVLDQSRGFSELREAVRHLEQRFDARFGGLEQRFEGLEQRFDQRFQHLEQRVDVRFDVLEQRYNSMLNAQMVTVAAIVGGFVAMTAALLSH